MEEKIPTALTFDDVLLLPQYSEVLPHEVDISTYITKTLGWKPKTSLERGLKLEMDWLKENPEQWKDETFQFV